MHHKRNNFLWIPILFTMIWACQMDKKPAESTASVEPAYQGPLLLAIADGKALLSDSTTVVIPHHSDTAYTIFFCVRHAEKRKDQGDNPDLSTEGVARAERLGLILKDEKLDEAYSTNYKRTIQTAEAVRRKAAEIPTSSVYPPAMQDAWLDETLKTRSGGHFLVVGHQNTVPQLLNLLKGGSTYQNIPDNDHGRFYIAITKGIGQTEVIELRY